MEAPTKEEVEWNCLECGAVMVTEFFLLPGGYPHIGTADWVAVECANCNAVHWMNVARKEVS